MTNKQIRFVGSLKRGLRVNVYFCAAMALIGFSNSYAQFFPDLNVIHSFFLGIVSCYLSLTNYLGDTRFHMCIEIIEELMNKDPDLIMRLREANEKKEFRS